MKTLEAFALARGDLLNRMGGDWLGELVIQPMAGLFSVVAVAASPVEDARLSDVTHAGLAVTGSKTVSNFNEPTAFPAPIHWETVAGIGAVRALDLAVEDTKGMPFDESGEITVRLDSDHYVVTFPIKVEPGARGPDFAFRIYLNPKNGEITYRVQGN